MQTSQQQRRSARIILLDERNTVLLIRFSVTREAKQFVFWATPGGGVEDGESEIEAAQRELAEELHLHIPLTGPVHAANSTFEHKGATVENTDVFFFGRCSRAAPRLDAVTEDERDAMQLARWWSPAEIEQSEERIFPPDLGPVIRALAMCKS